MSLAYTLTPSSMNILLDGRMRTISSTHMNFASVVSIVKQLGKTTDPSVVGDKLDALRELIDIKLFIAKVTEGRVQVGDTAVYFDGKPCHNVIATRILKMLGEGFDIRPMARFLDKLMQNPLESARNELYEWLEKSELPIAADGDFLAFKKVNNDYKSYSDSTTDNSIGSKPSVSRDSCDTNRSNTCSSGLHFCSFAYLPHYMGNQGRVVICKINPADVTAIPNDYDTAKGRAWTYEIIGEVPEDEAKAAFPDSVVEDFGTYHDAGEDSDDSDDSDYDDRDYSDDDVDPSDYDYTETHASDDDGDIDLGDIDDAASLDAPMIGDDDIVIVDESSIFEDISDTRAAICLGSLEAVIAGDVKSLSSAFLWRATKQGAHYWSARCYKEVALSGHDLAMLRLLRDRFAASEAAVVAAAEAAEADDHDSLPAAIDEKLLLRALKGDDTGLFHAFVWADSPQGSTYWRDAYLHLRRRGELPHDAELILASWARRLDLLPIDDEIINKAGPAPTMTDEPALVRAIQGNAKSLFTAFTWRTTQQGFDYWHAQYNSGELSAEALDILEAWAKELGIITKPPVTFMHGGKVYYPEQLRDMLKEHGQRGTSRLTGVPRSTLQDWAKRI